MEIRFDQFGGRQAGLSALSEASVSLTPLDWHGLMARLAAAHAARQLLSFRPSPGNAAAGSFAPGVARDLAAWRATACRQPGAPSSPGVNLTAKADGKTLRTIGRIDAGEDRFLVRGLS